MTARLSLLATPVLTAALVLGLAGCGQAGRPGTAAVVDGRVIATDDVARTSAELNRYYQGKADEPSIVLLSVLSPFLEKAAAQTGGWAPGATYYATLDKIGPHSEETERVLRASVLLPQVRADSASLAKVSAEVTAADIAIDPRYGTINPRTLLLQPTAEPWIAAPSPTGS